MMKLLFSTVLLFCVFISGIAQQQKEMCSSAIIHNRLMQTDPAYRAKVLANEQLIQNVIQEAKSHKGNSTMATVYTIPVVVHVIHLGESVGTGTNISDAQIQSAVNNLNDAFRNHSPYTGVDIEVQFALAKRDPSCNSTTGIVRVNGSGVSDYSTNGITNDAGSTQNEVTIKALSKWPSTNYYNIWVVAGIDGNMGGGGVQGYAYFPGAASNVDGAVMLYTAFGYDPSGTTFPILNSFTRYNTTFTHEMGHAFNLYHSFEGDGTGSTCPSSSGCGSGQGDCCSDTPPHKRSVSDCNTSGTNSCDGNSSNALFVHNFMDYSSDACKTQFTPEQKVRMRAAIVASRNSLINSLATSNPGGSLPTSACAPVEQNVGNYPLGVYGFTFNDLDVSSGNTYSDGGYVDRTCYFQTTVTAGSTYPVTVNTGTPHNHDVRVYIDFNNDGDFVDAGETVFSSDNVLTTHSGNIAIPASPPITGQVLRMRVFADYEPATITPCFNPLYGQAEDFGIIITSGGSAPVAAFTASPTTVCAGTTVNFTDQSTNTPTSWSWVFQGGNPSASNAQNPTITYTAAGTYSVSLTATNVVGSDGDIKAAYITVRPVPTMTLTPTNANCGSNDGAIVAGASGGTSPYSYSWSTGVSTSAIANLAAANYTCTVADNKGCASTKTVTVLQNGCGPTELKPAYCGITVISLSDVLYCEYVPGATKYEFRATDPASSYTAVFNTSNGTPSITMQSIPGIQYGKTYNIEVRAMVNSVWTSYGNICQVTTPLNIPTSKLKTAYCGITISSLSDVLYCDYVTGASSYGYRLINTASSYTATYSSPNGNQTFAMISVPGVQYAKTYNVEVRAKVGGVWGNYGSVCTVSTPSVVPTTKLKVAYCGITLNSLSDVLYCDFVNGATNYGYRLINTASSYTTTYTSPNGNQSFAMISVPGVQYANTYSVEVRAKVGGAWGNYGSVCTVSTPSVLPTTKLKIAYCGITLNSLSDVLYCDFVNGATNYGYRLINTASSYTTTYTSPNGNQSFAMISVPGIQYANTYSVEVRAKVGGAWGNYGSVCAVTTPAATPSTKLKTAYCGITLSALSDVLYCDFVNGATNYGYRVINTAGSYTATYTSPNGNQTFAMSLISGLQSATTYSVDVRSKVGGVWSNYGQVCTVTTPSSQVVNPYAESSARSESHSIEQNLLVFPNPVRGNELSFTLSGSDMAGPLFLEITNAIGIKVYETLVEYSPGANIILPVDERFAPGAYFINATAGDERWYQKFMISK